MNGFPDTSTAALDAMPVPEAAAMLTACLDAEEWAAAVLALRPFGSFSVLEQQAVAAARTLSDAGLAQALAAHPRIGERPGGPGAAAAFSRSEQSGVTVDTGIVAALREANRAYEQRFGHVFLIRAAGRDATEILVEARRRLRNDEVLEAAEVREQLGQIAVLRLRSLLADQG